MLRLPQAKGEGRSSQFRCYGISQPLADQHDLSAKCAKADLSNGRSLVLRLLAQHFIDEGNRSMTVDQALLTSIATHHVLLPHSAIRKHEF